MATQTPLSEVTDDQNTNAFDENPISGGSTAPDPAADSDITPAELELLDNAGTDEEDELTDDERLDSTDEDGDELNEADDLMGEDLDVPGSDADNADEAIGEEDEENNSYSISDQDDHEEQDGAI